MKLIKRMLYILSLLIVYELSKYVTNEIIIKLQANDDIDQPKDYEMSESITESQGKRMKMNAYNLGGF